ncbi:MAG: subtype II CRISPR-associated endonuclease Cas1 [Alphaproteobacteria bacterium]|nr:MAG: subtype II CRISPR-associated endonuclease Cas1 [Alphaproteobacteria bacterium]
MSWGVFMSWRTLLIQQKCHLSKKNGQLFCKRDDGVVSVPIEDITIIILETPQATITSSLLAELQEQNVVLITCNGKHMPNGMLLPLLPHSRVSEVAFLQNQWSSPFRKRCWQKIVKAKINNQARSLEISGRKSVSTLRQMARRVQSGDPKNREAQAAREYWSSLMGDGFVRGATDFANNALNYGYMVLRAVVARSLVSYGLLPCFGLHHDNNLNAFNLADDILEPFRPMVDQAVMNILKSGGIKDDLSRDIRQEMALLAVQQVRINDEVQTITNAADVTAYSLVNAIRDKDAALLKLPDFVI